MTARTKRGYAGHKTHGADPGSSHHRLMHQHTHGHAAGTPPPPQMQGPQMPDEPMGPPGAMSQGEPSPMPGEPPGAQSDDTDGEQT